MTHECKMLVRKDKWNVKNHQKLPKWVKFLDASNNRCRIGRTGWIRLRTLLCFLKFGLHCGPESVVVKFKAGG